MKVYIIITMLTLLATLLSFSGTIDTTKNPKKLVVNYKDSLQLIRQENKLLDEQIHKNISNFKNSADSVKAVIKIYNEQIKGIDTNTDIIADTISSDTIKKVEVPKKKGWLKKIVDKIK